MQCKSSKVLALASALAFVAGAAIAAPTGFQERTLRVGNGVSEDHPNGDGERKMAQCAAEKSGGKMKIQLFWNAMLGNELATIQQVRTGSLEMVLASPAPITGIVPELGVLDLPFLFDNATEARRILDGKIGDWFGAKMMNAGLVNLAWMESGFRHTTSSKRPITKWKTSRASSCASCRARSISTPSRKWAPTPCRWLSPKSIRRSK